MSVVFPATATLEPCASRSSLTEPLASRQNQRQGRPRPNCLRHNDLPETCHANQTSSSLCTSAFGRCPCRRSVRRNLEDRRRKAPIRRKVESLILRIEPAENGLTFNEEVMVDGKVTKTPFPHVFDGKDHPHAAKNADTMAARRTDSYRFEVILKKNGSIVVRASWQVSADARYSHIRWTEWIRKRKPARGCWCTSGNEGLGSTSLCGRRAESLGNPCAVARDFVSLWYRVTFNQQNFATELASLSRRRTVWRSRSPGTS